MTVCNSCLFHWKYKRTSLGYYHGLMIEVVLFTLGHVLTPVSRLTNALPLGKNSESQPVVALHGRRVQKESHPIDFQKKRAPPLHVRQSDCLDSCPSCIIVVQPVCIYRTKRALFFILFHWANPVNKTNGREGTTYHPSNHFIHPLTHTLTSDCQSKGKKERKNQIQSNLDGSFADRPTD